MTFQDWQPETNRRVIREITEVVGFENGHYQFEPLMRWNEKTDSFELTTRAEKWQKPV